MGLFYKLGSISIQILGMNDFMKKMFRNPCGCGIINSDLYRLGDSEMGKVSNLERDTVGMV